MDEKRISELRGLFLFQLLTMEEMTQVADILHEKTYASGTVIFYENDQENSLYVVKSGSVKITKMLAGVMRDIIIVKPGEFFGEIALFEYITRTANAAALENASILEIAHADFHRLFTEKPQIAAKILYQMVMEMCRKLRLMNMQSECGFI